MTLKMNQILNITNVLKALIDSGTLSDTLLKFEMLTILKTLTSHCESFDKIRNDLITSLGKEDENGNILISKDDTEAIEKFNKEIESILEKDIEVGDVYLNGNKILNNKIDSNYLMVLMDILKMEEK